MIGFSKSMFAREILFTFSLSQRQAEPGARYLLYIINLSYINT